MKFRSVTVIIPTIGRSSLYDAVESALNQTVSPKEILICADTLEDLHFPKSPLVRVLRVGPGAGGNHARNTGAIHANSELIALLDDDDKWRKTFLETSLTLSQNLDTQSNWLSTTRVIDPKGRVYPRRVYSRSESLLEYMMILKNGVRGKGALMTPTMLFPRRMMIEVPWAEEQRFHQDMTWIISLQKRFQDFQVLQSRSELVELGDPPRSVSKSIPVELSIRWATDHVLFSGLPNAKQAFGDFLLSRYPARASLTHHEWEQAKKVYDQAIRDGEPSAWARIYYRVLWAKEYFKSMFTRK